MAFEIKRATSPQDLTAIRSLFTAYASSLPISLTYQNFSIELDSLPGLYAEPIGSLLLAFSASGDEIGCVAIRPLPLPSPEPSNKGEQTTAKEKLCEMKRLYCVPEARGIGLGKALVVEVIREAEKLGYEEVRLDTLPSMGDAKRLYEALGFVEIERYYDTPVKGTLFMGKKLSPWIENGDVDNSEGVE